MTQEHLVTDGQEFHGTARGFMEVTASGEAIVHGIFQGQVLLLSGSRLIVHGWVQGEVTLEPDSEVLVLGDLQGDIELKHSARLVVEPGGCVVGRIRIEGELINRGLLGGQMTGARAPLNDGGQELYPTFDGSGGQNYSVPPRNSPLRRP